MIQAIVWPSVLTSGAGMSRSAPMRIEISVANRRVMCSSSLRESSFGLTMMPPFAPPNGMFTTAHFAVIHIPREVARELTLDLPKDLTQPRLEVDQLGRGVELRLGSSPLVCFDGV